jgi:hypothetical protein
MPYIIVALLVVVGLLGWRLETALTEIGTWKTASALAKAELQHCQGQLDKNQEAATELAEILQEKEDEHIKALEQAQKAACEFQSNALSDPFRAGEHIADDLNDWMRRNSQSRGEE